MLRERLSALLMRSRVEAELDEELRFHPDRETEKNLRAGMTAAEARRVALVRFGGVERANRQRLPGQRHARPEPEGLVNFYRDRTSTSAGPLSYPDCVELRERTSDVFRDIGGSSSPS
jgi:hypothetical protein